jgi:hypothetical protein
LTKINIDKLPLLCYNHIYKNIGGIKFMKTATITNLNLVLSAIQSGAPRDEYNKTKTNTDGEISVKMGDWSAISKFTDYRSRTGGTTAGISRATIKKEDIKITLSHTPAFGGFAPDGLSEGSITITRGGKAVSEAEELEITEDLALKAAEYRRDSAISSDLCANAMPMRGRSVNWNPGRREAIFGQDYSNPFNK